MDTDHKKTLDSAKSEHKEIMHRLYHWKQLGKDRYHEIGVANIHQAVFEHTDCISCHNCCSSSPPLITPSDIKRLSAHLGISKKAFIRKYILEDFNGEQSFNKVPCHFLNTDGTCNVYELRPDACRRFPHTDEEDYFKRPKLNTANTQVCPAAYKIYKRLESIISH